MDEAVAGRDLLPAASELASLEPFSEPQYAAEAAEAVGRYLPVLEPLSAAMGPNCEIVLHDFSRLPNSIIALYGNVSGRTIGGPATNLGLRNLVRPEPERSRIGYRSVMPNGVVCRSSSIYLFGSYRQPVGALCINVDVSTYLAIRDLANAVVGDVQEDYPGLRSMDHADSPEFRESFYKTVDQAAEDILHEAIEGSGVPVELMSKKQKVNVVKELRERGFFLLRGAVDLTATALDVTRYTVYAYINEAKADDTP